MSIGTSRVDLEEVEITTTEKLLAVVLVVFLLIGGVWTYSRIDNIGGSEYRAPQGYFTVSERADVLRADRARQRVSSAEVAVQQARQDLELAREVYRTALDAGRAAPALETAYRASQRDLATAQAEARASRLEAAVAQPAADTAYNRANREALAASRQSGSITFVARLALVLVALAFGFWLLVRLRRSTSRYLVVGFAFVAFAAILALVMAGDYTTDYIDVRKLGPLVLSVAGIAFTLAVFWWLQRYLARRIPARRVRRAECPFCGYPVHGGPHCEGCGRTVLGECAACHEPRRVGTFHCGACGAA